MIPTFIAPDDDDDSVFIIGDAWIPLHSHNLYDK